MFRSCKDYHQAGVQEWIDKALEISKAVVMY
jgi:hypothetical protein